MRIGAMNHPGRDPVAEIDWIGAHGFDFVDFTLEPPAADPEKIDVQAILAALKEHRLDIVAHTAWFLPLGSPFARIRQATLEEFRRALQAAHRLGARVMNAHYRSLPPHFTDEDALEWHAETLTTLCEEAADLGMQIALEHMPHGGSHQLETFVALMKRVPRLRFHLDSGHAKLERGTDRYGEYLAALSNKLMHVHLSDNDGTADQHLPLSSAVRSQTDWPEHVRKLKATGYDSTITLEVFSPNREYLLQSRDLLRRWWDEA